MTLLPSHSQKAQKVKTPRSGLPPIVDKHQRPCTHPSILTRSPTLQTPTPVRKHKTRLLRAVLHGVYRRQPLWPAHRIKQRQLGRLPQRCPRVAQHDGSEEDGDEEEERGGEGEDPELDFVVLDRAVGCAWEGCAAVCSEEARFISALSKLSEECGVG